MPCFFSFLILYHYYTDVAASAMFRTLAGPRSELVLFRNSFSFGTPLELLWIQITGKAEAAKSASDASVPSLQRPNETLTQQSRSPKRQVLPGGRPSAEETHGDPHGREQGRQPPRRGRHVGRHTTDSWGGEGGGYE